MFGATAAPVCGRSGRPALGTVSARIDGYAVGELEALVAVDAAGGLGRGGDAALSGDVASGSPSTLRISTRRSPPSAHEVGEGLGPRAVVERGRERDEVVRAAVVPHQRQPVAQHDDRGAGAGRAAGRLRPGQRGAVGLGRIGGRQHDRRRRRRRAADRVVGALAHARSRSTAPGRRELGRAEPADEVAAADLAALLEHLEHAVHRRESADDALGEHGLAGDHAVALDELQRRGVGRLGRRRHRLEQRRDEAPAPGPGRRADAGRAARARAPARTGSALARRGARAARRAGEHRAQRRQRVVGDLARPHEVPQRGEQLVVGGARRRRRGAGSRSWPRARRAARRIASCSAPSGRSWTSQPGASSGELVGEAQPHPPVARADRAGADPHDLARRCTARRAAPAGSRRPAPASTSDSSVDATIGAPASRPSASTTASTPRRCGGMPCHAGRKRASASGSTGSTSRRSAASDRRRSWRSTSTSHHSRRTPSGRNSPRTMRSSASSAASAPTHPGLGHAEAARRPRARRTGRGCGRSGRRGPRAAAAPGR